MEKWVIVKFLFTGIKQRNIIFTGIKQRNIIFLKSAFQYSIIPLFLPRETFFLFHWGHFRAKNIIPKKTFIFNKL